MQKDLGSPFAYGRTAEFYAWDDKTALKLFHNWFEPRSIEYEAKVANAAFQSGLNVPAVNQEVIQINNSSP